MKHLKRFSVLVFCLAMLTILAVSAGASSGYHTTTALGVEDGEVDTAIVTSKVYDLVTDAEDYTLRFYYTSRNEKKQTIMVDIGCASSEYVYADFGICATQSATSASVNTRDYIYLEESPANDALTSFTGSDVDVYVVESGSSGYVISTTENIFAGDALIVVVNVSDPDEVLYVIDVTQSEEDLSSLWQEIALQQGYLEEAEEAEETADAAA